MGDVRKPPGYMTEDLEPRIVAGPPRYRAKTSGPIEYLTIADPNGLVLGYIYANDDDDVVGWMPRSAAGQQAHSAYFRWLMKLRACKARGLIPSAALDELVGAGADAADDPRSHVAPGPRRHAPSVEALREVAEAAS